MTPEESNLATARRYLESIERRADSEEVAGFFAPDVIQEEFPNQLVPKGACRDLAALKEAGVRGRQVMSAQRYEVLREMASGDRVALEVLWTGTLAVPFGSIPAGGTLRAHFAVFIDFRDGRIVAQRNYDCFDPW
jgi:ketosteroid isomerase-like protein